MVAGTRDGVCADEAGFDREAAGSTHRVEYRPSGGGSGEVHVRPGICGRHAPRLKERTIRRVRCERARRLVGDPAERTQRRPPPVCPVDRVVFGPRTGGEQRPQHVVRRLEVDVEPAADEHTPQGPLCGRRRNRRRVADVSRPHGDGTGPRQRSRLKGSDRGVDGRVGSPDRRTDSTGVRQRVCGRTDAPGARYPGGYNADSRGGRRRFGGRERVRLAGQLEPVHLGVSVSPSHERDGSGAPGWPGRVRLHGTCTGDPGAPTATTDRLC